MAALGSSQRIRSKTKDGKPTVKRIGTALSYRFVRDGKGWRIFVSVEASPVEQVSRKELGAIGVDVNADHLAASETDRFGNLIDARRILISNERQLVIAKKPLAASEARQKARQSRTGGRKPSGLPRFARNDEPKGSKMSRFFEDC